jgi:hypothetical protein
MPYTKGSLWPTRDRVHVSQVAAVRKAGDIPDPGDLVAVIKQGSYSKGEIHQMIRLLAAGQDGPGSTEQKVARLLTSGPVGAELYRLQKNAVPTVGSGGAGGERRGMHSGNYPLDNANGTAGAQNDDDRDGDDLEEMITQFAKTNPTLSRPQCLSRLLGTAKGMRAFKARKGAQQRAAIIGKAQPSLHRGEVAPLRVPRDLNPTRNSDELEALVRDHMQKTGKDRARSMAFVLTTPSGSVAYAKSRNARLVAASMR